MSGCVGNPARNRVFTFSDFGSEYIRDRDGECQYPPSAAAVPGSWGSRMREHSHGTLAVSAYGSLEL